MTEQRRLAAVVSADVGGYSRLMGRDEGGTLAALKAIRQEVVDPAIATHGGRIVKTTGDGLLLEFPSVVNAVRCAASGRAADLRQAGYVVEVFLSRSTCPQPSDARCLGSQAAPFDGPR
jgi:class 3 adenylate cyclase